MCQQPYKQYTFDGQFLKLKGKVVIGANSTIRIKILRHLHNFVIGGHSGDDLTYRRIKGQFYWRGLQKAVKTMGAGVYHLSTEQAFIEDASRITSTIIYS